MQAVEGVRLVVNDIALLGDILSRRDPDLVASIDGLAAGRLEPTDRERFRRAIVDELCELPEGAGGRRVLELEQLLTRLGRPEGA